MQVNVELPNQQTTWEALSLNVEEFADWKKRTGVKYASENAELLAYLLDQLKTEGAEPGCGNFNHPVLGLLSYMSESNNRMRELLFAYLALSVANNDEPARKLVAGQRLTTGLHPDYVAETRCYGVKGSL